MIDTSMSHIGFRCVIRAVDPPAKEEVSAEVDPQQTKQSTLHTLKTSIKKVFRQFRVMRRALGTLKCHGTPKWSRGVRSFMLSALSRLSLT